MMFEKAVQMESLLPPTTPSLLRVLNIELGLCHCLCWCNVLPDSTVNRHDFPSVSMNPAAESPPGLSQSRGFYRQQQVGFSHVSSEEWLCHITATLAHIFYFIYLVCLHEALSSRHDPVSLEQMKLSLDKCAQCCRNDAEMSE